MLSSVDANLKDNDDPSCSHLWARHECGYLGINQELCLQRQCCWSPALAPVPWCFEKKNEEYACKAEVVTRRDCGWTGISAKECYDRNCCWDSTPNSLNSPFCFLRQQSCKGYAVDFSEQSKTGLILYLKLQGTCQRYGEDSPRLSVHVDFETEHRIRIRIIDPESNRYEIPSSVLPNPKLSAKLGFGYLENLAYRFDYTKNPFTFSVIRNETGEKIFDSNVMGMDTLVYESDYLEISTTLPEAPDDTHLYGLGEVATGFRRDTRGTRQAIWARDAATPLDENLYGSHPFHMEMRRSTSTTGTTVQPSVAAHGVFLRSSNGMDVILSPGKLTYKVIGGILDFSLFLGPSPTQVLDQYTELIGRPHMPPAWALGFHQSRYGYKNIEAVEDMIRRYHDENLPLDGIWLDIDYMEQYRDFTYDDLRFPKSRIKQLATDLANMKQNMILIVDPGIAVAPGYEPYETGMREKVFLMRSDHNGYPMQPAEGRVWPGQTYFPDFLNQNETWHYWEHHLSQMRKDLGENVYPWIDMNEPSSFCSGECTNAVNTRPESNMQHHEMQTRRIRYSINNAGREAPLDEHTLDQSTIHKNGIPFSNTHNLYGHLEAMATHQALSNIKPEQRPFILTRSSFAGTGVYAAHWTGDNWSEWNHLHLSISGTLSFGLFGIPFTGADICGFNGNTTEELCLRWHQLGALYPFSRNHNDIHAKDQEPYNWPQTVLPATRQALNIRYSLLPYFYTKFELAHRTGQPVWQPLFFEYPEDTLSWDIDRQFLLGDGIMVSPALNAGQIQVKAYFPGDGRWFDLWTHECLIEHERHHLGRLHRSSEHSDKDRLHRYRYLPANAKRDPIPMSLAGGHVVPIQKPRLTVAETRMQPISLIIGLDQDGNAKGEMFVDDGESASKVAPSVKISWEVRSGAILISHVVATPGAGQLRHGDRIDKVTILGLNFDRIGGEQENLPSEDLERLKTHIPTRHNKDNAKEPLMDTTSSRESQHLFNLNSFSMTLVPSVSQQYGRAKRKSIVRSLNVNGIEVPVSPVSLPKDSLKGLAWEVNEALGYMTLTGLNLSLIRPWAVRWTLE
ncbi:hypothetical protein EMPS_07857 [Entomortierella parvispora]|uniref:Maltase n=1 Tax=Entomortierella parvispora TaxID=205924 RepID=A0A9P3HEZ7_9FUNG|nr:hypothetical protein EMPS_07857 [Entomortierella parvispora]